MNLMCFSDMQYEMEAAIHNPNEHKCVIPTLH
jgi:hypothetical protein